jgi:hypothetical protein
LLPAFYRSRDADRGYPLMGLLRVINEQVEVVRRNIDQLYDNWFVETAEEWALPYIGDLIGFQPVTPGVQTGDPAADARRDLILSARAHIGHTIRDRRGKGVLALLELIAQDVAGWPARAVEFYRLLGRTQNLSYLHTDRGATVNLRDVEALSKLDGPFDQLGHTVDVRRIGSAHRRGRYNIPSVGLFVWRLRPYSVTGTAALCLEEDGPHCYTFSALGQDTPLYRKPAPERRPADIAGEMNVPAPITRYAFEKRMADFYGAGKSMAIYVDNWGGYYDAEKRKPKPVPIESIIAADLTNWHYVPPRGKIAVDPVRGRIAFPPGQTPRQKVQVDYYYGFSENMGGGEYDRVLSEPRAASVYTVSQQPGADYIRIVDALDAWRRDRPADAVIEILDSAVYIEQIKIVLDDGQSLQLRAANRRRPILRLIDLRPDLADALSVEMSGDSRLVLDGLLITARAVHIRRKDEGDPVRYDEDSAEQTSARAEVVCGARVVIRHCTLVPGWGLQNNCEPRRPTEPSIEVYNLRAALRIEKSIVGSIQIHEDAVNTEPIPLTITDSVVDATGPYQEAIGAPGSWPAHAVLTVRRATIFGIVQVHAVELAENSIFMDCVHVARRQIGCMRFCYVPPGCRTPRRSNCQPDMVDAGKSGEERERERQRVRPRFNSVQYGTPAYCQLAETCAQEIKTGADDESEMGVFHDLFQPQREANLRGRLGQFVPAGMEADILFVS